MATLWRWRRQYAARLEAEALRRGQPVPVSSCWICSLTTVPRPLSSPGPDETPVPDESPHDPVPPGDGERAEPSAWPLGIVLPDRDGVHLVPLDAPERWRLLDSGGFGVAWAIPDQRDGLIFRHTETPEPWPPGAIMRLRASAVTPEVLVPPAAVWEPSNPADGPQTIAGLWPFGVATSSAGHATFVYTAETGLSRRRLTVDVVGALVMAADLEGQRAPDRCAGRPATRADHGPCFVAAGRWRPRRGERRQLEDVDDHCPFLRVLHVDLRTTVHTNLVTCELSPGAAWALRALSYDGRTFATLEPSGPYWSDIETFDVTVINVTSGRILEQRTIQTKGGMAEPRPGAQRRRLADLPRDRDRDPPAPSRRDRTDKTLVPAPWEEWTDSWHLGIRTGRLLPPADRAGPRRVARPAEPGAAMTSRRSRSSRVVALVMAVLRRAVSRLSGSSRAVRSAEATIPQLQEAMEDGRPTAVEPVEFSLARIDDPDVALPWRSPPSMPDPAPPVTMTPESRSTPRPRRCHIVPAVRRQSGTPRPTGAPHPAARGHQPSSRRCLAGPEARRRERKHCVTLNLDAKHRLIATTTVSIGSIDRRTANSPRPSAARRLAATPCPQASAPVPPRVIAQWRTAANPPGRWHHRTHETARHARARRAGSSSR